MFSLDTIFISLTFLILSVTLIKIKSLKAIIPLAVIYVFFILNKLSTEEVKIDSKIDNNKTKIKSIQTQNNIDTVKLSKYNQVESLKNEDVSINQTKITYKKEPDKKLTNKEKKENDFKTKSNEQKNKSKVKKEKQPLSNLLSLKEIKICKNIKNRSPIGVGEIFPSSVDSLYCYTKIENLGKKMEVRHVWYYENQIMTQVRYNVKKSNVYRSWTKKTISSFQIGNWRVEVQDRNGTIIGTKRFKIKKSS
tara:strand:+ start:62 stop:811 length:750 start_codon:yes stop_codon:yes gene_type:complete